MNIMLLDVCLSKGVLEIIRIAKIIMNIISIVAPLLLMFSIMFKFIKAIYHKDNDAFEQAKRNIVSNVKVLLLLFIIPFIVGIILSIVPDSPNYKQCMDNATSEVISQISKDELEKLIARAEESLNIYDYNTVTIYIDSLSKEELEPYKDRIEKLKISVYAKYATCTISSKNDRSASIIIQSKVTDEVLKLIYTDDNYLTTIKEPSYTVEGNPHSITVKFENGEVITCSTHPTNPEAEDSGILKVYFFGVGRFDSYLIIGNDTTIFIDGGYESTVKDVIKFIKKLGITKIDALIGSHLHDNHIKAHVAMVKEFEIGSAYYGDVLETCVKRRTCIQRATNTNALVKILNEKGIPITYIGPELDYKIGNINFDIVAPQNLVTSGGYPENTNSLNMILKFGSRKIYFSGDNIRSSEVYKNYSSDILDVDVLKYPHHGLATVSDEMIKTLSPEYIIVPNRQVSDAAKSRGKLVGAKVMATGSSGYILLETDGTDLTVNQYSSRE